jgi:hypothetical protein
MRCTAICAPPQPCRKSTMPSDSIGARQRNLAALPVAVPKLPYYGQRMNGILANTSSRVDHG